MAASQAPAERPASPSATVIALRDGADSLEVLLARRNSSLDFYGGAWVFPGGRVDAADHRLCPGQPVDGVEVGRAAAVRELAEETGIVLPPDRLTAWAHWTTPPTRPKRFATWFFVAGATKSGPPVADGAEIHDVRWEKPDRWLQEFDQGGLELAPPTWLTLKQIADFSLLAWVLDHARSRAPLQFKPRHARSDDGAVISVYEEDAAWATGDAACPGPRHRIIMRAGNFTYEHNC